jgi:hypothetical protein
MQTRRDHWSAAAITAGLAYLVWRAAATLGGVPVWLSAPALFVEVLGWMGLTVVLAAVRRRPAGPTALPPRRGDLADVIIRVDGQPVSHLLATLAGVRHVDGVTSTTIALFAPRPELERLAVDHGIPIVHVSSRDDAAGFRAAMSTGTAMFVALLDAGDVPTPDFLGVLARHADDGYVAAVVGRLDCRSSDSAEHDLHGRHERRFEREMLLPSAGSAATIQGSGTLLRRWAIGHVGVPSGSRRAAELRLSGRLRRAGLRVVAPTAPVVVWARPMNSAVSLTAAHRRETAGVMAWMVSADGPLRLRGISWRDRFALCSTGVRPLSGLRRAAFVAVLVVSLLAGRLPLSAPVLALATVWVPYMVLRLLAWYRISDGRMVFGEASRWSFATMASSVSGLFGAGRGLIGVDASAPRLGGRAALRGHRALIACLLLLGAVLPLVAVSDQFTGWLPVMPLSERVLQLAVAGWAMAQIIVVLRSSVASRQRRRSARVPIAEVGRIGDLAATFVDLTPFGAGAMVHGDGASDTVHTGDRVTFQFEVATPSGRHARATGSAVVRSTRRTSDGLFCGLEFEATDFMSSDAIYEFCEVVYAVQHARQAVSADAPAPAGAPRLVAAGL